MNHFNRLPEDIVHLIFLKFNYKQLLELETVCKHWKNVLRSRVQYWNTEIYLDCQSEEDFEGLENFTLKRLSRSKGEMQSWRIKIDTSVLKYYQSLFERIPASNPHSLDIEITDLDCYPTDTSYLSDFEGECSILINTIKQCSNLKALKIKDLVASFGSDLKDCPIANCKLETLKLDHVDLESLLTEGSISTIVSQAKRIDLFGNYGLGDMIRLIDSAKDTLEVCSVRLESMVRFDHTIRSITLPRLKRLEVYTYYGSSSLTNSTLNDPIQSTLICPNLQDLSWRGDFTSSEFASLLTDSIKTLYLEVYKDFYKLLGNKLRKCSNLSILRISVFRDNPREFPPQVLEKVLNELILLPIKEFLILLNIRSNVEIEQIILNFFRKWSNNSGKMKLFLLYQDVQIPEEILEELLQYCEVVKAFSRDRRDLIYFDEEKLGPRIFGNLIGI